MKRGKRELCWDDLVKRREEKAADVLTDWSSVAGERENPLQAAVHCVAAVSLPLLVINVLLELYISMNGNVAYWIEVFLIDLPSLRLYGVLYGAPSVLQNMRGEPVSSGAVRTFLTVSPHARHMSSVTGANLSHSYQSSLSTLPSPLLTPHTALLQTGPSENLYWVSTVSAGPESHLLWSPVTPLCAGRRSVCHWQSHC